jgi:mRNA interferase RelE/StbE
MRRALRALASTGGGDIKALEGELAGFYRLRVGGYRIIFSQQDSGVIQLEYADLREPVYEVFVRLLKERLD